MKKINKTQLIELLSVIYGREKEINELRRLNRISKKQIKKILELL